MRVDIRVPFARGYECGVCGLHFDVVSLDLVVVRCPHRWTMGDQEAEEDPTSRRFAGIEIEIERE